VASLARTLAALALATGATGAAGGGAQAQAPGAPFAIQTLPADGRTVAAELADVDGDGRADLVTWIRRGLPPDEQRRVEVRFGTADGALPAAPDLRVPLAAAAGAYDVGPLDDAPGAELLHLEAEGVAVLSLAGRSPRWRMLRAPVATAAPGADERGLDRLRLLRAELGPGRLLVPGLGTAAVLGAGGEVLGVLRTGARANYFLPPRPGPLIGENELELFFDVPRLEVADVDGDGRADVVAAGRHELRVFLQRDGGRFRADPDRSDALRLLDEEDHVRNSGGVRVDVRDWDGDGRADLLVAHASGGLLRATTRTRLHRNRGGRWDLAAPDQVFERSGGVGIDELLDLDGDGRPDLLRAFLPLGLLDLARLFVQRSIQVEATLHRNDGDGAFEPRPWVRSAFSVAFDFETVRPRGFVPTLNGDWNADGHRDLLSGGDGTAVDLWLGGPRHRFATRTARQALDTGGRLRIGDLDGDGLPDFALYDPRSPSAPVRVARNLARLPDTPARIHGAADADGD
jgi:hypothetical protein